MALRMEQNKLVYIYNNCNLSYKCDKIALLYSNLVPEVQSPFSIMFLKQS